MTVQLLLLLLSMNDGCRPVPRITAAAGHGGGIHQVIGSLTAEFGMEVASLQALDHQDVLNYVFRRSNKSMVN